MKFLADYNDLTLLAVAIISGLLLFWAPIQRRIAGGGGAKVGTSAVTQLTNRRNVVMMGVHENAEYAADHLPQAKHAPLGELAGKAAGLAKNKETPIILACQIGQRARWAQTVLKQAGYNGVYSLEGGLATWQQTGLPVMKQRNKVEVMTHMIMYSTTICPYCMVAERLLKQRGAEQIGKILIDRGPGKREEMMTHTNHRAVPQIYIGERHIDGFDNLSTLDRGGDSVPLLAA